MGLPLIAPRRSDAQAEASFAPGQLAAPVPFWSAVHDAYEAQRHVSQLGARDSLQAAALADRDAEIRKRLGYGYTPPGPRANDPQPQYDPESRLGAQFGSNPAQGTAPQYLSPGYEAWVDQQRELHPAAMADIPTAQQLHDQTSQRIGGYARAGAEAATAHPLGAFVGGMLGSFTDPTNAAAALIPVGGEARLGAALLGGTAKQAATWAAIAAAQAPLKAAEAQRSGGPAYTTQEEISDVEGAAVGGAVLHAGGTLLSAGATRLLGKLTPEAFAARPGGGLGGQDAPGGAGQAQPPPGPSGGAPDEPAQPSSSIPADLDADGRYPLTPDGHIVSDAGGPVQFDTPTDAARFILREANRTGDQRFEPANHPDGRYTVRELTRATAAPDAAAASPEVEPDAVPAAAAAVEQGANDDAAIGSLRDGGDYDGAQAAVAQGDAPAMPEPTQDPDTLLTDADPETGPATDTPPVAPGVTLGDSTTFRGRDIYAATFDPQVVNTAPEVFQYKAGGDAAGVTDRLRGVQTWDPTSAGRSMVFEDGAGAYTIADGHQRLGLAKRLADQDPTLDALLFRQADGWSAQDVRTLAALKNIREGSGTPLDAAKVLRDHPEALNDDSLPVTGTLAEQGRGLARLSDDAFGAVVNDVIPQHHAALIGNMAGDRPDLHAGMVDLLHRGRPANVDEARALVSEALHADWLRGEGSMADLFGGEAAQSTVIARAKVTASVLRSLRQNARLFSTLVGNADAIEAGGNALARSANEASLAVNRAAEALISKLAQRSGEVGDAMRAAAAQVTEGKPVAEAAKNVLARVTEQIRMADEANATRKAELDPDPAPPRDASVRGDLFDGPGDRGQQQQLVAKPEDAAEEAVLFDKPTGMGNAADILRSCAPE